MHNLRQRNQLLGPKKDSKVNRSSSLSPSLVTQSCHPPTFQIEPLNESMEKMNISDNLDLHLDKSAEEAEAETEGEKDVNEEESIEENQGQVKKINKKRLVYKKI